MDTEDFELVITALVLPGRVKERRLKCTVPAQKIQTVVNSSL